MFIVGAVPDSLLFIRKKMPLTKKGKKIMKAMVEEYHSKKKGEEVFYASMNKGKIKGVHKKK